MTEEGFKIKAKTRLRQFLKGDFKTKTKAVFKIQFEKK